MMMGLGEGEEEEGGMRVSPKFSQAQQRKRLTLCKLALAQPVSLNNGILLVGRIIWNRMDDAAHEIIN